MYHKIETWLNDILGQKIPSTIKAFCFNLYEDEGDGWSIELVGTETFDLDDEDWACDEITDFGTRNKPLSWQKEAGWTEVLSEVVSALKQYLENGSYADVLKSRSGVAAGFADGDLEILYSNLSGVTQDRTMDKMTMKEKLKQSIEQKISEWQEDDIYAISLYVFDEEDDPCRPVAVLGYNTERQVQKSTPEASDEQETRWNYAFWLQNEELRWGQGDTAEDIKEWITEQDLGDSEDEIREKFVELLVVIVQDIHASGLLKDKFGKEIPILIHELEYYEKIALQNIEANGEALDRDFVSFCMPEAQDEILPSQNEMPMAEKRITSPRSQGFHGSPVIGKKSTDSRTIIAYSVFITFTMFLFWIMVMIISNHKAADDLQEPVSTLSPRTFSEEELALLMPTPTEPQGETPIPSELEEAESEQIQWQVYIPPDMPEPYVEVLKQYEQVVNADVEDFNDEEVMDKFYPVDGEWRYVYDLYGRNLMWRVRHNEAFDHYTYSLMDLTGDGFPELIMGYYFDSLDEATPEVVYYYSETEGIKMECLSDYYDMALYEGGIIEYLSGGVTYTMTYLQFQEETESWELAVRVVVDWDSQTDSVKGYYWGDNVGDLFDNPPMSEEEYQEIIAQYAAEPVELEWTPLILNIN